MRIFLSISLSVAMVFGLLLGMSQMVSANASDGTVYDSITIEQAKPDDELTVKPRDIKKPEKPKPAVEKPVKPTPISQPKTPNTPVKPSQLTLGEPMGPSIDSTSLEFGLSNEPMVIDQVGGMMVQVEPKYPRDALLKGIEGKVKLAYDISAEGKAVNIRVLESTPKNVFDRVAVDSLKKSKYQTETRNGKPVSSLGHQVTLEFQMEEKS